MYLNGMFVKKSTVLLIFLTSVLMLLSTSNGYDFDGKEFKFGRGLVAGERCKGKCPEISPAGGYGRHQRENVIEEVININGHKYIIRRAGAAVFNS
ncbi:hypothetical protein X975_20137, partial [Stegodyphus mimosarum]